MTLLELKKALSAITELHFKLENGEPVPAHFHITEIGKIDKAFIDCGGTMRKEEKINFQLWESIDYWHRLQPQKLLEIIELAEAKLDVNDRIIEVEYQRNTIGKYGLQFDGKEFLLIALQTNCLANDACGVPIKKIKKNWADLKAKTANCCSTETGCC